MKWFESPEFISRRSEYDQLLQRAGSNRLTEASEAQTAIAAALTTPLRQGVFSGDLIGNIFTREMWSATSVPEYPLDIIRPGSEGDFVAYTMPDHGGIPMRRVEGDRIMVQTYRLANSIDCTLRVLRNAQWNIVQRMMEALEAGFVKKMNDDGFATILMAGIGRNILAYDADATAGQFTPRLVSLMKTIMRRNGGGNSTSLNRGKLTDLYLSPESVDDVRAWTLNLIPDAVRSAIFYAKDGSSDILSVYDVKLHDIDELGVGQQYQNFYSVTQGKSLAASDVELVIGLDLDRRNSFVMPVSQDIEITDDSVHTHRQGLASWYATSELGFGVLDSRTVLLGSL